MVGQEDGKNYISVMGTDGELCMETISSSGPDAATAVSFVTNDFSQGGLNISSTGNYQNQVFRFVRASDGKCFTGELDFSKPINVWNEIN